MWKTSKKEKLCVVCMQHFLYVKSLKHQCHSTMWFSYYSTLPFWFLGKTCWTFHLQIYIFWYMCHEHRFCLLHKQISTYRAILLISLTMYLHSRYIVLPMPWHPTVLSKASQICRHCTCFWIVLAVCNVWHWQYTDITRTWHRLRPEVILCR